MRRIVIPTTYDSDTLEAMKIAFRVCDNRDENIILVSTSEINDSIQSLLFLSADESIDQVKRRRLMQQWSWYRGRRNNTTSWEIVEHHQFGMTPGIGAALAERFRADLVIVPSSVSHSRERVHLALIAAFEKSKCAVMRIPIPLERTKRRGMLRTLLVGDHGGSFPRIIDGIALDIVHHIDEAEIDEHSVRLLVDALSIDLVIQKKGGRRIALTRPSEALDIAVLSV